MGLWDNPTEDYELPITCIEITKKENGLESPTIVGDSPVSVQVIQ